MSEETKIAVGSSGNELIDQQLVMLHSDAATSTQKTVLRRDDLPLSWKEDGYTVTRTTAWSGPGCHEGCGVLLYVNNETGKVEKVEGDPEHPYNQGHLCPRCLCLPETIYHKDRITKPMIRDPKDRGKDKWKEVSWDEAYDYMEKYWKPMIEADGDGRAIMMIRGTGRDTMWQCDRFMYAIGSTHDTGNVSGNSCFVPRAATYALTVGGYLVADCSQHHWDRYDHEGYQVPEYIFVWGCNPLISNPDWFFGDWIVQCMKRGSKIVSVDPRLTWLSQRAELWLQVRPGTDPQLACAMLKVVIEEDLVDHEFIDEWCYGYDELKAEVATWDLDELAEATWIPKEKIIKAARMFAAGNNTAIQFGVAVDQSRAGVGCCMAGTDLLAITGNIDVPGGMLVANPPYGISAPGLGGWGIEKLEEKYPGIRMETTIGVGKRPLMQLGMLVDHPDDVLETLKTKEPYEIKSCVFFSDNALASITDDTKDHYQCWKDLEFNVVLDIWMTPTAFELCDVFLPCQTYPESDSIRCSLYNLGAINGPIDRIGDTKDEIEIINDIAKRFENELGWDSVHEGLNEMIAPAGVDFEELKQAHWMYPDIQYRRYETGGLRADGLPGFQTPTGKIELFSTIMDSVGLHPMPYWSEPWKSPYSQPELAEKYPFILMTGARDIYFHSEGRQIPKEREIKPYPIFEIHPDAAAELGINEGDWCWLENDKDGCILKAKVTPIVHRKQILADHAWWLPEQTDNINEDGNAFNFKTFNPSNLIDACMTGETGYGADIRCTLCSVRKCTPEELTDFIDVINPERSAF